MNLRKLLVLTLLLVLHLGFVSTGGAHAEPSDVHTLSACHVTGSSTCCMLALAALLVPVLIAYEHSYSHDSHQELTVLSIFERPPRLLA